MAAGISLSMASGATWERRREREGERRRKRRAGVVRSTWGLSAAQLVGLGDEARGSGGWVRDRAGARGWLLVLVTWQACGRTIQIQRSGSVHQIWTWGRDWWQQVAAGERADTGIEGVGWD